MAATQGEQFLIVELNQLAAGQAPGSFGPGQALALLVGYIKLRDRVDSHTDFITQLLEDVAAFAGIDVAARLAELEQARTDLQTTVAGAIDRIATLEQERVADDATIADQAAQIGDLEERVAVLEENQPPPTAPAPA